MSDIVQNGVSSEEEDHETHYRREPKSELFTIELGDN